MGKIISLLKNVRVWVVHHILASFIVCALVFASVGTIFYVDHNLQPKQTTSEEVLFRIDAGEGVISVINRLAQQGIIRSSVLTRIVASINNVSLVQSGQFIIDKSWSPERILRYFQSEDNAQVDVALTILPQDWAKVAADKIAAVTTLSADELLAAWNDADYIQTLMVDYPFLQQDVLNPELKVKLEGYLYPDTYYFYIETTVDAVTRKILDNTKAIYETIAADIPATGLDVHQVFTLASMVGFEASSQSDRNLVAGVFLNRLHANMLLQSSVTVCYALYDYAYWSDCERNSDLDSPYNTYLYQGLPVGPILNPTLSSLEAVLHPQASDYYYFMADVSTGTVYYARTYEEHLQNIAKYGGGQ